jgi:hypothetical protein
MKQLIKPITAILRLSPSLDRPLGVFSVFSEK